MITALGGGVGAAKFLMGLAECCSPKNLNVIVNTGDDIDIYGLRVSPDIDTIIYRLSENIDEKKGWGLSDDTFNFLQSISELGVDAWFNIGDKDLATHLIKNSLRQKGLYNSEITKIIAEKFGVTDVNLIPMSDDKVETWIDTEIGIMHFQEYYIKNRMTPEVKGVEIRGKKLAKPAPGAIAAIENAKIIMVCPSNPIISIGPILQIYGIRDAIINSNAIKVAISPLIGGKPLKGPTDKLMKGLGMEVSSTQVSKIYSDFLDIMVIDNSDKDEVEQIESLGITALVTDTLIPDKKRSKELSKTILEFIEKKWD